MIWQKTVEGDLYYHLRNNGGKEWLMPKRHLRTGLALYQPSSQRGKWLKRLLPYLATFPSITKRLGIDSTTIQLLPELKEAILSSFGIEDADFAIFCGTPCVHQKYTIQIFDGQKILGYCKVSDKDSIGELFSREKRLLDFLNERGMSGMPKVLSIGKTHSGFHYMVEDTAKTLHSTYPHIWDEKQAQYLHLLEEKTRVTLPYEQTDFYHLVRKTEEQIDWIDKTYREAVEQTIQEVDLHLKGKNVECCVAHGDFTPWNMFINDGHLFVFDWEYAQRTCPPGMDHLHFFTQTEIFEQHHEASRILMDFEKEFGRQRLFDYQCYLLFVMGIYLQRALSPEEAGINRWCELCHHIQNQKS